jgi:hypothetical protein
MASRLSAGLKKSCSISPVCVTAPQLPPELKINYLRPIIGRKVTARSRLLARWLNAVYCARGCIRPRYDHNRAKTGGPSGPIEGRRHLDRAGAFAQHFLPLGPDASFGADTMSCGADEEANRMFTRDYRKPFVVASWRKNQPRIISRTTFTNTAPLPIGASASSISTGQKT